MILHAAYVINIKTESIIHMVTNETDIKSQNTVLSRLILDRLVAATSKHSL